MERSQVRRAGAAKLLPFFSFFFSRLIPYARASHILHVLYGLLRQQLLDLLLGLEELKRRRDNAVEEEGEVYQQNEAQNLQPFERLPAKAERHDPDEERAACIDRRAGRGADGARNGQAEEVEATRRNLSVIQQRDEVGPNKNVR